MDKHYVIKRPLLTEKSTAQNSDLGRFAFEVDRTASKNDIKDAVEAIYKVNVVKVNTMVHKSRTKRNRHGFTGGKLTKKALVLLKEGQTIELF
ncbi:MAG TPA: 50S ribosomal protein L23 [Phycisphaerales bacterium]|nr:50S ribosomal protein L23 [Phycisphaerales bacterium]